MRQSEIYTLQKLCKILDVHPSFNRRWSYNQEWSDIPFPKLTTLKVKSWNEPIKKFKNSPNWFELLTSIDELLVYDGDSHHNCLVDFQVTTDSTTREGHTVIVYLDS